MPVTQEVAGSSPVRSAKALEKSEAFFIIGLSVNQLH